MQKKHMERCLFTLLVLLIFALTILGLYRVTKHSAAPASTTIPVVSLLAHAQTVADARTARPRGFLCCARHRSRVASVGYDALAD